MANMACGNAVLALVHALNALPAVGLPHGYANGVLLPHVAAFNRSAQRAVAAEAAQGLGQLYERIGFTARFLPGEVPAAKAEALVGAAINNPFRANNVRETTEEDLRALLREAGADVG
jgi:alcohol dehydrogenase class IV